MRYGEGDDVRHKRVKSLPKSICQSRLHVYQFPRNDLVWALANLMSCDVKCDGGGLRDCRKWLIRQRAVLALSTTQRSFFTPATPKSQRISVFANVFKMSITLRCMSCLTWDVTYTELKLILNSETALYGSDTVQGSWSRNSITYLESTIVSNHWK